MVSVIPIPSSSASVVKDIFNLAAQKLGFKFTEMKKGRKSLQMKFDRKCSLFYVELPGDTILYHSVKENETFPAQFGREVLAGLLNKADRADWKNCKLSKDGRKFQESLSRIQPKPVIPYRRILSSSCELKSADLDCIDTVHSPPPLHKLPPDLSSF